MHILHIVTRLLRAGSEENTIETCRWQARAGHRVTLIHGREADPAWRDELRGEVDIVSCPWLVHPVHPGLDLRAWHALRATLEQLQPDVVHTHQSKAGLIGRLAARAVPGAIVVHGIHIVPFDNVGPLRRRLFLSAERLAARNTDLFIGVSEAVGRAYVDNAVAPAERVCCVRSGMDLSRFRRAAPPADWRSLLRVPAGARRPATVVMLAALEPRKRHVPLLRALAGRMDAMPPFRLVLAGAGPEAAAVKSEIEALGLQDRVVACGHREDPEALLALADLSILASEREGLPRVVVQSIAAGCPVLVSDLPGIGEVVRDGVNGAVVPRDDLDGLVTRLRDLLADRNELQRLRAGALDTDVAAWSLDALGARTTALYQGPARSPQIMARLA